MSESQITITDELIDNAKTLAQSEVDRKDDRNEYESVRDSVNGKLAELCFSNYLENKEIDHELYEGWEYDIVSGDLKIDVKCRDMSRYDSPAQAMQWTDLLVRDVRGDGSTLKSDVYQQVWINPDRTMAWIKGWATHDTVVTDYHWMSNPPTHPTRIVDEHKLRPLEELVYYLRL